MTQVSIRHFNINTCRYFEGVRKKGWSLTITYHDQPFAVVLPLSRYLELAEAEKAGETPPEELPEAPLPSLLVKDWKPGLGAENEAQNEDNEVDEIDDQDEEEDYSDEAPLPQEPVRGPRR